MGARTGLGFLLLVAVSASCAAPRGDDPEVICRSAVAELNRCAAEIRTWQSQEVSERPECIGDEATTPSVAAMVDLSDRRYADQPDSHRALDEVARRLDLANRLLNYGKPAEAELLLRDVDGRCAKLPA